MTTPTKSPCVIFLNIHGVLLNQTINKQCPASNEVTSDSLDQGASANLSELIERIQEFATPQIVISSNWRRSHFSVEDVKQHQFSHDLAQYVVGDTKLSSKPFFQHCNYLYHKEDLDSYDAPPCKGSEINAWLKQNPNVKQFVILDDTDSHLSTLFKGKFIQINDNLLTKDNVNRAINSLLQQQNSWTPCCSIL